MRPRFAAATQPRLPWRERSGIIGRMKAIPMLILCAALASGCVVTKRVDGGHGDYRHGDAGIAVEVWKDGSLAYQGRKISRERLVRELRGDAFVEERGQTSQRAVILEAQRGVPQESLVEIRDYLVANRIPRIVLRTARSTEADVGGIDADRLTPAQRTFRKMIETDAAAARGR